MYKIVHVTERTVHITKKLVKTCIQVDTCIMYIVYVTIRRVSLVPAVNTCYLNVFTAQ
jgi:hypothetical protein